MLKGADILSDDSSDEDKLDQKTKELEKKLQQLLLEKEQHKKEQNSITRKHAYLQSQVKTLSFVAAMAPALEAEKGASNSRYEAMRRRRDARLAKSNKPHVTTAVNSTEATLAETTNPEAKNKLK